MANNDGPVPPVARFGASLSGNPGADEIRIALAKARIAMAKASEMAARQQQEAEIAQLDRDLVRRQGGTLLGRAGDSPEQGANRSLRAFERSLAIPGTRSVSGRLTFSDLVPQGPNERSTPEALRAEMDRLARLEMDEVVTGLVQGKLSPSLLAYQQAQEENARVIEATLEQQREEMRALGRRAAPPAPPPKPPAPAANFGPVKRRITLPEE